jgi:hypothetical protein
MLASIAAAASALRSPSGGLLPPSSAASHHPYLASAFSNALGGLSALTSGLSVGGSNGGAHGSAGGQHPPLTPSPSSDSPQQTDAPRGAPNSSQQSWTFEEQFKQVSLSLFLSLAAPVEINQFFLKRTKRNKRRKEKIAAVRRRVDIFVVVN